MASTRQDGREAGLGLSSTDDRAGARSKPERAGLKELLTRLTRTQAEVEAEELQEDTDRLGATPIARLADREVANVCGNVESVTLRPRVNVPALVVDLYDGSQTLHLVWLGRRQIRGIECGTYLKARGRVTYKHGVPTIFNPAYEIVPDRGHAGHKAGH